MRRTLPLIEPLESRYAPASLSIAPVSEVEGTGGTKIFNFKVTLSEPITSPVTVAYATGDGTATTADNDYTAKAGFLTFSPATGGADPVLEQTISIVVTADNKFEAEAETFIVSLLNPSGATIGTGEATGTIQNDDTAPKISIGNASISEGNIALGSPGTPQRLTFTVSLSNASYQPVSVTLNTVDGTASSVGSTDFVAKMETITFDPGQTSKTFIVDLNGDIIGEVNEAFTVELSNPVNGTLNDSQKIATGTIINDDPTLRISDVRVAEGNPPSTGAAGTTDMIFTVVLDRAGKNDQVTVDFSTANGTAIAGVDGAGDYTAQSGTLTFQPGETTKQIIVKVNKDAVMELDETVLLNFTNATNAYLEDPQVVGTIGNDEITASLQVNDGTQLRKKEAEFTEQVVFTVKLSAPAGPGGVDVNVLFGGSATKGEDYNIVGGNDLSVVHFDEGQVEMDFFVTVTDDLLASLDETLQVNLSGATNAVVAPASSQVAVVIENDDGQAFLQVNDVTIAEGPGAKAILTVSLSKGVEGEVSFTYSTVNGTALAGTDFTSVSQTGKILAGELSTQIEVSIVDDELDEKDEKFTVQLSGGTGGATTVGGTADPTGEVTITDNDDAPTLKFDPADLVSIVEGDNGTKVATYKLKLSEISGRDVTVRVRSVDGSAIGGQDFVTFDQVITFGAGQTEATFSVVINGDTADEIDENFFVQLSEVDGATIEGASQVETKILNNDRQITIGDVSVSEGAGQASFTVRLNAPSLHPVTVTFKTSNGTAVGGDGTGADDDYINSGEITVTFNPGEVEQTVTVNIVGDTAAEVAETFFAELTNPANAVITTTKATATIVNDDKGFLISDGRVIEGGPGATTMMVFIVTRQGPSSGTVTVDFATENGTAVEGSDYTRTAGTLTFGDGVTTQIITVPILGDSASEGSSEVFSIKLSNPSAGVSLIDDTAIATIVDDEGPVATISDVEVIEGDSGTKQMIFVVTVTGAVSGTVQLNYATLNGTATTADFTNTSGTLNFSSAGSQTIIVPIIGDLVNEGDQNFFVKLTADTDSATVAIADDTGEGTIEDNDAAPVISIEGGKVAEGNSGVTQLGYTIKLDRPSDKEVTVEFFTGGGTATPGSDYNAMTTKKVTFLPGQTSVDVFVEVIGDTTVEAEETITGNLANATNATIGTPTGDARILNDELSVTIANGNAVEDAGTGAMTVSLSSVATFNVTVTFAVMEGTALLGSDFTVNPDGTVSVTIPAGQLSANIGFAITDDDKFEGNETFTVKLVDAQNAVIGEAATGTFTIVEDETVTISVSDQYVFEGETAVVVGTPTVPGKLGGTPQDPAPEPTKKSVQFTVSLSGPSERAITVNASSFLGAGDAALAGSDFVAFEDTEITFAPGETSKTITVEIFDDQVDEAVESFKIKLEDANLGTISGDGTGTIRIVDNDLRGVSIGDAFVVEGPFGPGGERTMTFTLTLSAAATQTVSVLASTLNSSATAGLDYAAKSETITFNPGETTKTFTVTVNGDATAEADELFAVSLTNVVGAIATDAEAEGRIVTDEILYKLTPVTTTIAENAGVKTVTFTVSRVLADGVTDTTLLDSPGSVSFTTVNGTAKAGSDFISNAGFVNFSSAVDTSETITVTITDDTAFEVTEDFLLRLTGSTGGALAIDTGVVQEKLESTVSITSEDAVPTISIADVSRTEGNSGTSTLVFTVKLSAANEQEDVVINFSTEDGTATSILANPNLQDFVSQSGTLTFAKGETTKTISIVINGDTRDEADSETFKVKLTGTGNAPIAEATGTITDDDATPKLTFDGANNGDITVIEGNDGVTTVKLRLKLSTPSEQAISVNVSLVPGTAVLNEDYQLVTDLSQPVTFAPGATTAEVEFRILPDATDEVNETFQVSVAAASGSADLVTIQDAGATITITDDDPAPKLAINDVTIVEGDDGTSNLVFTVTIDGTSDREITVDFATLDGTAVSGGITPDFAALSGRLTFAVGATGSQTISVPIYGDEYKESNETFQVKLSDATNATIARDTGSGTIQQDEDTRVILTVNDAKVTEGNSGTKQATFTVQLSAASDSATTFTAFTQNGTAVEGVDYTSVDQAFTIPAGSTSVQVSVTIRGDGTFEFTESFFLSLTGVSDNVEVFDGEGRGTIYNDDIDFVNPRVVRYIDVDGDLVTIKITKGLLFQGTQSILTFEAGGSTGGQILAAIDFTGNPSLYNGTSLSVTAEPQPGFFESGGVSDGKADVGFIQGALVDSGQLRFIQGIDFTNITIEGDLGGMTAGDRFVSPSIRGRLSVESIGVKGTATLPGSLTDNFLYFSSKVNAIKTTGDVLGVIQTFGGPFGDIGKLEIGGALRGVSQQQPGKVVFTGTLSNAVVGQIVGGALEGTGSISGAPSSNATIGSVRVLDAIIGGAGKSSGSIEAQSINSVSVGVNPFSEQNGIIGGGGENSGSIIANRIGSVTIGSGAQDSQIKGGTGKGSGLISAQGSLGKLTVFGDIVGGTGENSAQVFAAESLGSAKINGSLVGGGGTTSGAVFTNGRLNSVAVTENITGGAGSQSGIVHAGSIGSLKIGTSESSDANSTGSLIGGRGQSSGLIDVDGGVSKITIYNDLRGGLGSTSGGLQVDGAINSITIHGDLQGGNADAATADSAATSAIQTGFITADRIAKMTIKGDWTSGTDNGSGLADSGAVRVAKDIGTLKVEGNVVGNTTSRVVLAAAGTGPNHVAIKKLVLEKDASYFDILGGYFTGASLSSPLGTLANADATIGNVTFGGTVLGVNIVSGAAPGTDGRFGTSDDAFALGANVTNNPSLLATIAKVTFKGAIEETADAYGIVAQYVKKVVVGNDELDLLKGPSNDKGDASKPIGGSETFRVVEL